MQLLGYNRTALMLYKTFSAAVFGIDAYPVEVEVDVSAGQGYFTTVGLPDAAVRESRERIKSAIKNCGLEFPFQNTTVNLAPADIKKEGSGFDLAIALGILGTTGVLLKNDLNGSLFLGELSLDGSLRPIKGALSIASMARQKKIRRLVLPAENACEAAVVEGVEVYGLKSLPEVLDLINETREFKPALAKRSDLLAHVNQYAVDFRDVKGRVADLLPSIEIQHEDANRRRQIAAGLAALARAVDRADQFGQALPAR